MYDYHIHSGFSYDAYPYEISTMVEKAIELDLIEIAITDHYDPLFPFCPAELDFPRYFDELQKIKEAYAPQIKVAIGIELGVMTGKALDMCREVVEKWPLDFVMASFHSAKGFALHTEEFRRGKTIIQAVNDYYEDVLTCITEFTNFDVLGHINVIDRYVESIPDDSNFSDIQTEILKTLVTNKKGLEINTSSYRYGTARTLPTQELLNEYVELGGEIVTIGSDAHRPIVVGDNLDRALNMMKKAGLNKVATYEKRQVSLVEI